jgi:hypothetical protein
MRLTHPRHDRWLRGVSRVFALPFTVLSRTGLYFWLGSGYR